MQFRNDFRFRSALCCGEWAASFRPRPFSRLHSLSAQLLRAQLGRWFHVRHTFFLFLLYAGALQIVPIAEAFAQFHQHASSRAALRFYWGFDVRCNHAVLAVLVAPRRHEATEFIFFEHFVPRPLPPQHRPRCRRDLMGRQVDWQCFLNNSSSL